MNKNTITLEQLIAASLLIFNELNSLDIELIIEEAKKSNINIKGLPFNELNKFNENDLFEKFNVFLTKYNSSKKSFWDSTNEYYEKYLKSEIGDMDFRNKFIKFIN